MRSFLSSISHEYNISQRSSVFSYPHKHIPLTVDLLNGTKKNTISKISKKKKKRVHKYLRDDDRGYTSDESDEYEYEEEPRPNPDHRSVPAIYFLPETMIGKTVHSDQEASQLFGSLCCSLCGRYFSPGSPEAISHIEEEFGLCYSSSASINNNNNNHNNNNINNNNSLMMTRTNIGSRLDRVSRQKNRSNFLISDSREEAAVVFLHVAVTKPACRTPLGPDEARKSYDDGAEFQWDDPDQFSYFGSNEAKRSKYNEASEKRRSKCNDGIKTKQLTDFRLVIACSNKTSLATLAKHINDAWFFTAERTFVDIFIPTTPDNTDRNSDATQNSADKAIYVRVPHINAAHMPLKERDMARCTVASILGDVGRSATLRKSSLEQDFYSESERRGDIRTNQDRAKDHRFNIDITIDVIRRVDGKSTFLSEPITVMRNTKFLHAVSMVSLGLEQVFLNSPLASVIFNADARNILMKSSLFDPATKHNLANTIIVKSSKRFRDITDSYAKVFEGKNQVVNEVKAVLTNKYNEDRKFRVYLFNPKDELVENTKTSENKKAITTKNKKAQQTKKKAAKKEIPTSTRGTKKPSAKTSSPKKKAAAVARKPKAKASSSATTRKAVATKKKPIAKKPSPKKAKKPAAKKTQTKKKK